MSDNLANLYLPLALMQPVFLIAKERGISREQLLLGTGIATGLNAAGDHSATEAGHGTQISLSQARALLARAAELTGDSSLPLTAGNRMQPALFGRMGFLFNNARNLRHVFALRAKFSQAISAQITETLIDDGDTVRLCVVDPPGHDIPPVLDRGLVEYQLAMLNRIGAVLLAVDDTAQSRPLEAAFRHPAPAHLAHYQQLFGHNVQFSQASNWLRYRREHVDQALPFADASVAAELEQAIQAELRSRPKAELLAQLRDAILAQLSRVEQSGLLAANAVAERLNIARSTLHRRLQEHGTNFSAVRDQVLHDKALELMATPGVATQDVAQRLGYCDTSAFDHAFHRWTGQSPSQWRRQTVG